MLYLYQYYYYLHIAQFDSSSTLPEMEPGRGKHLKDGIDAFMPHNLSQPLFPLSVLLCFPKIEVNIPRLQKNLTAPSHFYIEINTHIQEDGREK